MGSQWMGGCWSLTGMLLCSSFLCSGAPSISGIFPALPACPIDDLPSSFVPLLWADPARLPSESRQICCFSSKSIW